jgi:septum site-determining protein MinC
MTSDSVLPNVVPTPTVSQNLREENIKFQVRLKTEDGGLQLILPAEAESSINHTWTELWEQLKHRLNGGDRFWQPQTKVRLMAQDRLLDGRQLKAIADALKEVELQIERIYTTRRQTAVAAATAGYSVEQQMRFSAVISGKSAQIKEPVAEPLYLELTVRSGVEIRHPGTVVIVGDVNPGGSVIAVGDILVWGRLRGIAHAGCQGNSQCRIMALQMEPTQLRIASSVARAPDKPPKQFYPEVAYISPEGILRIGRAADFTKTAIETVEDKR